MTPEERKALDEWLKSTIGASEEEVKKAVADGGAKCRVMKRDGESSFGTCDLRPDRVNLEVENGIVRRAWTG